jgi:O-antigen ligase
MDGRGIKSAVVFTWSWSSAVFLASIATFLLNAYENDKRLTALGYALIVLAVGTALVGLFVAIILDPAVKRTQC